MATNWFKPHIISQYSEVDAENLHVRWDDSTGFSGLKSSNSSVVGTLGNLIHIARSPKPNIRNKTYFLKMTGFNFTQLPNSISGVELEINSNRAGRVTDEMISLVYNNELIGDNQASLEVAPTKIYGGSNSLWGLNQLLTTTAENSSFGVVARFQSHLQWPHTSPMDLISVRLRIH